MKNTKKEFMLVTSINLSLYYKAKNKREAVKMFNKALVDAINKASDPKSGIEVGCEGYDRFQTPSVYLLDKDGQYNPA